jgi:hypothetical protein
MFDGTDAVRVSLNYRIRRWMRSGESQKGGEGEDEILHRRAQLRRLMSLEVFG